MRHLRRRGRMATEASRRLDVAFLAGGPGPGQQILFTAPYLEIETTYLGPPLSLRLPRRGPEGIRMPCQQERVRSVPHPEYQNTASSGARADPRSSVQLFSNKAWMSLPASADAGRRCGSIRTRVLDGDSWPSTPSAAPGTRRRRSLLRDSSKHQDFRTRANIIEKNGVPRFCREWYRHFDSPA